MKPLTMGFPKRMTIDLPERLRNGLEAIANRERHESDEQLVRAVLARGIAATLADEAGDLRGSRNEPAVESDDHHDVELYVAFPITEDLRDKLEDYLAGHRESDAESIYAALLGLGLQKAEEDPAALDPAGLKIEP